MPRLLLDGPRRGIHNLLTSVAHRTAPGATLIVVRQFTEPGQKLNRLFPRVVVSKAHRPTGEGDNNDKEYRN